MSIRRPQRGPGRELVTMAARHAAEALEEHSARAREAQQALALLAYHVGLEKAPDRIEGYDLSHFGGSEHPHGCLLVRAAYWVAASWSTFMRPAH